jgi:GNAT superfamily N-acetyltransferase
MVSTRLIQQAITHWRTFGLVSLTKSFLLLFFQKIVIFYMPLTTPIPKIDPEIPVVVRTVCKKHLNDLYKLSEQFGINSSSEFVEWFRKGYAFLVAIADKNIIGYASAGDIDEWSIKLQPSDAVGLSLFVRPEYRGRRVGPSLVMAVARHLQKQGYRRVIGATHFTNTSSRKAHVRAGYIELTIKSRSEVLTLIKNYRPRLGRN